MTSLPLHNLRVLDLTHVWAGPLAVRFLSDLGAEVVKIEAPYGRGPRDAAYEPLGGWLGGEAGDEPWNVNAIFVKFHRNRKSLCLNLKQPRLRELFLQLVEVADVVIENFSADAMQDLGLGYEELKAINPKIIYVSMPGYGMSGPYRDRVAFGPTVEAMSGLSSMLGYSPDEPYNSAIAPMDPIGFALENFDAIGRWRVKNDAGAAIDSAGKLPSGKDFSTPAELKKLLAQRETDLARNLTERLMAYALGRQLEGYDEVVLDQLMERIARDEYRVQTIVTEVTTSYLFTHRRVNK